jgi:hypothetical protein
MLCLNASPDADRRSRRWARGRGALALPLGAALSALLAAGPTNAQPAQQQPAAAARPAQPGAPAQPAGPAQPGATQPLPGAAPAQPPPPVQPFPQAQPGYPPQAGAPQPAAGYPPPGYYGGYPPQYGGGYYPPPGYYYPMAQETPPAPAPPALRRRSDGMMYGGIALTSGGVVGFFIGTVLLATANNRYEIYCDYNGSSGICETRDDEPRQVAGAIVTVAGGLLLSVGIPLWVVGGKKVRVKRDTPSTPLQPTLSLGAGSAAVRMAF